MKNRRNYYRILHVQPDAPREVIKASYRTLMQKLKLHPDLGGDEWDASLINEAYATLSNDRKRAAYDQQILLRVKKTGSTTPGQETQAEAADEAREPPHANWKNPSLCPFCGTPRAARTGYQSDSQECRNCDSPLQRAPLLTTSSASKRKLKRIVHNARIRIYTSPEDPLGLAGALRNLSPQGLQLITDTQLEPGQLIRISSDVLSACAIVCYCNRVSERGPRLVGVKFITLVFHDQLGTFFAGSA